MILNTPLRLTHCLYIRSRKIFMGRNFRCFVVFVPFRGSLYSHNVSWSSTKVNVLKIIQNFYLPMFMSAKFKYWPSTKVYVRETIRKFSDFLSFHNAYLLALLKSQNFGKGTKFRTIVLKFGRKS